MIGGNATFLRERLQVLILYILSVLSFLALVWAVVSITRHVRSSSTLPAATTDEAPVSESSPPPTSVTPAGTRRNPVTTRSQSDWANLEKTIGGHDLGNTTYPRAAGRRNPPSPPSA